MGGVGVGGDWWGTFGLVFDGEGCSFVLRKVGVGLLEGIEGMVVGVIGIGGLGGGRSGDKGGRGNELGNWREGEMWEGGDLGDCWGRGELKGRVLNLCGWRMGFIIGGKGIWDEGEGVCGGREWEMIWGRGECMGFGFSGTGGDVEKLNGRDEGGHLYVVDVRGIKGDMEWYDDRVWVHEFGDGKWYVIVSLGSGRVYWVHRRWGGKLWTTGVKEAQTQEEVQK
ncbi:hypothetical protein Tco_0595256 [Tanacetum coccineum]